MGKNLLEKCHNKLMRKMNIREQKCIKMIPKVEQIMKQITSDEELNELMKEEDLNDNKLESDIKTTC
jgi:hypothetical protein